MWGSLGSRIRLVGAQARPPRNTPTIGGRLQAAPAVTSRTDQRLPSGSLKKTKRPHGNSCASPTSRPPWSSSACAAAASEPARSAQPGSGGDRAPGADAQHVVDGLDDRGAAAPRPACSENAFPAANPSTPITSPTAPAMRTRSASGIASSVSIALTRSCMASWTSRSPTPRSSAGPGPVPRSGCSRRARTGDAGEAPTPPGRSGPRSTPRGSGVPEGATSPAPAASINGSMSVRKISSLLAKW